MSNIKHLIRGISQMDVKSRTPDAEVSKYDKYIARLKAPLSLSESIITARKLVLWINQYQLGNPSQPWLVSRRLVRSDMPNDARVAGLELYTACVQSRPDLPAVVRLMFFQDIEVAFAKEDFDLQLHAFIALTKSGRDISGFENRVCNMLARWIDRALVNLDTRKPLLRRQIPMTIQLRHEDLRSVMSLINDVVKCHFAILEEEAVSLIVQRVILICKRTGEAEDIQSALSFLDVIIRYGYIPADALTEVVCVLCSIHHALEVLQEAALLVMKNLLRSHMSQGTLRALRGIILGWSNVHDDVLLGAIGILTTRWTQSHDEHASYTFGIDALLQTYRYGLRSKASRLDRDQVVVDSGHMRSVLELLSDFKVCESLAYEDWDTVFDILEICSRSLALESGGNASTAITITSRMQLRTLYLDLLSLLESYRKMKVINMSLHRLAQLWTNLGTILPKDLALSLLQYHTGELSFLPNNVNWLHDIKYLAQHVFMRSHQDQEVRLKFVQKILEVATLLENDVNRDELHSTLLSIAEDSCDELRSPGWEEALMLIFEVLETGSHEKVLQAQNMLTTILISSDPIKEYESLMSSPSPQQSSSTQNINAIDVSEGKSNEDFMPRPARPISNLLRQDVVGRLIELYISRFAAGHVLVGWLFDVFCDLLSHEKYATDFRVRALGVLSLMRADADHCLYLTAAGLDLKFNTHSRHSSSTLVSTYRCYDTGKDKSLNMQRYFEILYSILIREPDGPLTVKVLVALKEQLSNPPLFVQAFDTIRSLRQLACDRLFMAKSHVSSSDELIIHYVQLVALLIAFRELYTKAQEDELVAALQSTLMRYQRATQACIHTMTICAYELPLSTTKNLPSILIRLSQLVTSTNAALHILDFLSALATIPNLYINFREEDYRRVFGIALQHIQHANASSREALLNKQSDPLADKMAAYVLSLAYDVLCAWFLAVKLAQRPRYLKWIVDGLLNASSLSTALDNRALACYDFLVRFCYSNSEIRSSTSVLQEFEADQSSIKSWLYGNSVLTMKTMHLSGLTEITVRRPSGSTSYLCKPNSDLEALSLISSVDAKNIVTNDVLVGPTENKIRSVIAGQDSTAFTPSHILLQTSIAPELYHNERPMMLPEDDTIRRSLATLDRIPVVDFHKIAVIYIGRGQEKQSEILANTYGSPEYVRFLEGLGELVRLKHNTSIYAGGLDTQADEDGEFAYTYREKITQVIFHTCTLMPFRPQTDPESNRKKSHIGNDFVRIIWNSSNGAYDVHTIPSEFNFINIVVSPDAFASAKSAAVEANSSREVYYKVKLVSHLDLPDVSPVSEWRLISASRAASFVRTIAIHCNIYAQIYYAHGTYTGTWNQRLERINVLRQRTQAKAESALMDATSVASTGYDFTSYN